MIEAITYSFVLSGISTYYLYNKINKIFKYKQNINNFEIEKNISKISIKELEKQLDINKFWSDNIIQNSENQLLIVSKVSILAYQELILIILQISKIIITKLR